MKFTYWLYPARPVEREERSVDLREAVTYQNLRKVLDPLFFVKEQSRHWEHVTVLYEGRRADMFVDEMGAVDDLPRNKAATAIYRTNWLTQHPEDDPESLPAIYGLAVLFDQVVWT